MKLFSKPPKVNTTVAITYQIGWFTHQHLITIDSFEVKVLQSELNLMNTTSLISYTIKGTLKKDSMYIPYIQKAHHSEELINTHTDFYNDTKKEEIDACIRITPVVGISNKKRGERNTIIPFEFTNQYLIKSLHWGENSIQFSCVNFSTCIHLHQKK